MDHFEAMRTFVAVAEAGSFTAAADRLGVARSLISKRVSGLEQRLGVQLLQRTTRRVDLTTTGRSYYEHSARILADVEEAESAVMQEHGDLRGCLRVAIPLSFGLRHMCTPVAAFCAEHRKIEFDLNLNDRRVDLVEEGIDLAVRIGRLEDSSLIARKLFDARTVLCASPDYLAQHGMPRAPQDLPAHDCLAYSNVTDPYKWACRDRNGKRHEIRFEPAIVVNNGDFLCAMAAAGRGIALQPTFIAHEYVGRAELVPLLTDYTWPVTPAYAIYPPTRHLSYRVRAFIDYLAAQFSGTPYWDADCNELTD